MATFDMHILASRTKKGKVSETEAGRLFLLDANNAPEDE
jgi:hypothetical protein